MDLLRCISSLFLNLCGARIDLNLQKLNAFLANGAIHTLLLVLYQMYGLRSFSLCLLRFCSIGSKCSLSTILVIYRYYEQDLRACLFRTYSQVKQVRQQLSQLKAESAAAATDVSRCKTQKANLEAVMEKLKVRISLCKTVLDPVGFTFGNANEYCTLIVLINPS